MTTRTRTPSNEVEAAVVDAAERLLEAEGPTALTVRRIAAEAGVAPMGVYNHLGGKDGVVDELFIRGFDRLRDEFDHVGTDDPLEDLSEAGRRYRRLALAHPAHYAVMFDRAVPDYVPSEDAKAHAAASFGRAGPAGAAGHGRRRHRGRRPHRGGPAHVERCATARSRWRCGASASSTTWTPTTRRLLATLQRGLKPA